MCSPTQIHKLLVILLSATEATARPRSSRAASPTDRSRASLAACGGLGPKGNVENPSKAWPTTYVIAGAAAPAMMDDIIAGKRRYKRCLGEKRENKSLIDGTGGWEAGNTGVGISGISLALRDETEDRGERS